MKPVIFAALIATTAVVALAAGSPAARAETYPWCARYGSTDDDGTNCGFETRKQCMDTVFGTGGFCQENPFYTEPAKPQPQPAPQQKAAPVKKRTSG